MSNIIQIKHGQGVPNEKLQPYELGFSEDKKQLYIGGQLKENGILGDAIPIAPEKVKVAEKAEQLATVCTFQVDLESSKEEPFDGTANVTPGITGILPLSHGGLGASTKEEARSKLGLGEVAIEEILPIEKGGTGAIDIEQARKNLGLGALATEECVPIDKGGTGKTIASEALSALGGLPLTGGTMTGVLKLSAPKDSEDYYGHVGELRTSGLDCQNSDITGLNSIYFNDSSNAFSEGIHFNQGDSMSHGVWDTLYAMDGTLKFHPNRSTETDLNGYVVLHKGITAKSYGLQLAAPTATWENAGNHSFYVLYIKYLGSVQRWTPIVLTRGLTDYRVYHTGNWDLNVSFSGTTVSVTSLSYKNNENFMLWGII